MFKIETPLYPLPKKYDIVVGYFLDRDETFDKIIGFENSIPLYLSKHHYMLVIDVIEDKELVIVVYGTSQIDENADFRQNDFILEDQDLFCEFGIQKDTLFTFSPRNIAILPYNAKIFKKMHNKNLNYKDAYSPIVGRVVAPYIKDIDDILAIKNINDMLIFLKKNELVTLPNHLYYIYGY